MNKTKSKELYTEALKYLPGGVDSPVRAFKSVGGTPIFIKSGSGSQITDEDGNRYIDFCMSWGPLLLGHAEPDVIAAVCETAAAGTSFGTPHKSEVTLAKMVIDAVPSIEKIRFVNSGTEATMSAVRLARGFTGRDKIIKFDGCYHGHGDFLLVAAGSGLATFGVPDSAGVTEGNARDTIVLPFNDIEAVKESVQKQGADIAAIILEPVPCNNGMVLPKENYLKELRNICDEQGIVLIFDEVINGFRVGPGGAQQLYNVMPDLTTLGKIIGGGLPVGAYGGKAEIMAHISPDGPVYQAGTLAGNPLAMSAGIASLKKILAPGFHENLEKKAAYFEEKIKNVLAPFQGRVLFSRIASIFTFSFTDQTALLSLDDVKKCNMEIFGRFHGAMLDQGIYLAPSGFEVGFLSSAHSIADLDKTVEAVKISLEKIL